jgi:acyl-[acyl-carrier-protein]-phospholipid O-acyltransferase/long-chain-fatty-acid--[acyl-carrier-protein] ligase
LLDARDVHGGRHVIVEDVERVPLTYNQLLVRVLLLGGLVANDTRRGEVVGILLPNAIACVATLFGVQAFGRVPAMLNYTPRRAELARFVPSGADRPASTRRKRFVVAAKLEHLIDKLREVATVVYLEDLRDKITPWLKLKAAAASRFASLLYARHKVVPDEPAIVLFTSGSEGMPKGVALSHANVLANREQTAARVDFSSQDVILNALPLFHSFGLTVGTLLPLLSGMRTFFLSFAAALSHRSGNRLRRECDDHVRHQYLSCRLRALRASRTTSTASATCSPARRSSRTRRAVSGPTSSACKCSRATVRPRRARGSRRIRRSTRASAP